MIGVIAKLTVKPEMVETFEAAASELVKSVNLHEAGCLLYELYKSDKDLSCYVIMERYTDKVSLDAHGKTDYFLAAQGKLGPCLEGAPDIKVYTFVA